MHKKEKSRNGTPMLQYRRIWTGSINDALQKASSATLRTSNLYWSHYSTLAGLVENINVHHNAARVLLAVYGKWGVDTSTQMLQRHQEWIWSKVLREV